MDVVSEPTYAEKIRVPPPPLRLRYPIALGEGPDPLPPLDPCMLRHVYKAECVMMLLIYPLFLLDTDKLVLWQIEKVAFHQGLHCKYTVS